MAAPPTRAAVVVNTTAGRGRFTALLPEILARLGDVDLITAADADAAIVGARMALAGGASALIAVGGDGTVHAALQVVAGTGVPLGIVPVGTGNDLGASVGVPGDPLAAADAAVAALREGRTRTVDLARVTAADGSSRYFGTVLSAGFDALVNERGNAMRWPRGPRRYDVAIAVELARLRRRRYRMVLDGVARDVDAVLIAVANTPSYGGGMRICPAADAGDGLLDIALADVGRLTLLRLVPAVHTGRHVEHPAVFTYRARRVEISGPSLVSYVDGERLGPLPVVIEVAPGALTLLG